MTYPRDADGMTNSADTDQIASSEDPDMIAQEQTGLGLHPLPRDICPYT